MYIYIYGGTLESAARAHSASLGRSKSTTPARLTSRERVNFTTRVRFDFAGAPFSLGGALELAWPLGPALPSLGRLNRMLGLARTAQERFGFAGAFEGTAPSRVGFAGVPELAARAHFGFAGALELAALDLARTQWGPRITRSNLLSTAGALEIFARARFGAAWTREAASGT